MDVLKYLEEKACLVEREIDRWVPSDIEPETLAKATRHLLQAGGKRLRPCLVLTACEAVGGREGDAIETASALELLHCFTLIHDDIMDRDEFRRNIKTVHVIWGEPLAIIAGDALFAKVFEAIAANASRLGLGGQRAIEILSTISEASFEICQGQALDMIFEGRNDVSEQEYLEMISGKTGALLEASTKVGALLGGGKPKEVKALAEYGRSIGMAFQIRDDVLGLIGEQEKFGKPIGSDIREGKRTLIVTHALNTLPARKRSVLLRALGNEKASKAELERVIKILEGSGSIEYAAEKAHEFVVEAKSKLRTMRESEAKRVLLALADFTIEREF